MLITNLRLINFRNFEDSYFEFSKGKNIIIGKNGVGKTSLSEAISFCAILKSFRTYKDKDVINYNEKFATILANIQSNSDYDVKLNFFKDKNKKVFINDENVKKLSDFFSKFVVVSFTPDDLKIVKDSPKFRRKFFDISISQIDREYFILLQNYNKVLKQKNALLKESKIVNRKLLNIYNEQLSHYSSHILIKRLDFLKKINFFVEEFQNSFSKDKEKLSIYYSSSNLENKSSVEIEKIYLENYKKQQEKEILFKTSLIGIHKDDYKFLLNSKDSKIFGSQGQQRSIVISLKFSILNMIKKTYNIKPVLILDDIVSELDKERLNFVFNSLDSEIQTILTTVDINNIDEKILKESNIIEL